MVSTFDERARGWLAGFTAFLTQFRQVGWRQARAEAADREAPMVVFPQDPSNSQCRVPHPPSAGADARKLLFRQVKPYRHETVLLDGDLVPKSAAMLVSMLESETDADNRYYIYMSILTECRVTDRTAAAVKFSWKRYREFRDVTSMMSYSDALVADGQLAAGLAHAKEALEMAIELQELVNYAAGNLVRVSIKTGSAETVNEAIEALIDSIYVPRKGDCALETDWTDKAEALGADKELISWVRSVAASK